MLAMSKKKKTVQVEETDLLALFIKRTQIWVSHNFKYILSVFVSSVLILGLFFLNSYWKKQLNKQAAEYLYGARKALMLAEKKAGGDVLGFDSSQNFFGQSKKAKNNLEKIEGLSKNYIAVIKKHIHRPVALEAAIELAHFLYKYEKLQPAIDLLNTASSYKKKNVVGFLMSLQLGSYLMDKAEYAQAIEQMQFITEDKSAKWLWPSSLIKIALCYEKQNQTDRATETYLKIKKDFPDSQESERASQYLNLLALQKRVVKTKSNLDGQEDKKEGE